MNAAPITAAIISPASTELPSSATITARTTIEA